MRPRVALVVAIAAFGPGACLLTTSTEGLVGGAPGSADAADAVSTAPDAPADAFRPGIESGTDAGTDAASRYAAEVMADTPLAYYRLGERTGLVAHDSTGRGNDGAIVGPVTLDVPGALADGDRAMSFTSTARIELGDRFDFAGNVSFSFELWLKPLPFTRYLFPLAKMQRSGTGGPMTGSWLTLASTTDTTFGTSFQTWSGGSLRAVDTPRRLVSTKFTHIVVTAEAGVYRLYIDAELAGTGYDTGVAGVPDTNITFRIAEDFDGVIDEVAVYGTSLSPGRISAHFAAASL